VDICRQRYPTYIPDNPCQEMVNDACAVTSFDSTLLVLGHARNEKQVSILKSDNQTVSEKLSDFPHY
jgi:hypothetical protein